MSTDAARDLLAALTPHVDAAVGEHDVPGCAVGVCVDGDRVFRSLGVTSVEDPLPVTPDTLFQIGSVSKTFVALLVARHVANGTVALDDPVAGTLTGHGIDERITFRHVLTHSSGVSGDPMIRDAPRLLAHDGPDGLDVAIGRLARLPLDFEPGSDWSYSNAGVMLAAAALERLDPRPYPEQLAADVLRPLGMTRSCTSADEAITRRIALPHGPGADGRPVVLRDAGWQRHWQLPGWDVPGGGIVSTASDLLAYAEHVMSGAEPGILTSPQRSRDAEGESFGLAWYLDDVAGIRVLWHDGLTTGYCARVLLVPSRRTAVVVLTNGTGGEAVHAAVARAATKQVTGCANRPADLDPLADAAPVAGDYDAGIYGVLRLSASAEEPRGVVRVRTLPDAVDDGFRLPPLGLRRLAVQTDGDLRVIEPAVATDEVIACRRDGTGRATALRIGDRLATRISD